MLARDFLVAAVGGRLGDVFGHGFDAHTDKIDHQDQPTAISVPTLRSGTRLRRKSAKSRHSQPLYTSRVCDRCQSRIQKRLLTWRLA